MKSLKFPLLTAFLLLSATANCEENTLTFKDVPYPIVVPAVAETAAGAVLYETPFSEPPLKNYDTVLIQGEMPDPNIQLQVRVKNGAAFKIYEKALIHRFPNGRFWAKYNLGSLTREPLRVTVINSGVAASHTFTLYGVEAFRAAVLKEAPSTGTAAGYEPDPGFYLPKEMPFTVVRRADWKALPPTQPYTQHAPAMFTLHHTQGNSPKSYAEAVQEMQFIQDYHQNGRGWIDIGYHFLISPQGDIFEGRPINVLGAHVKNRNTTNVGISIMGNYHPPVNQQPAKETLYTFTEMGKYLKTTYDISVSSFYAHREIGPSDCPGDVLYSLMPQLKDLIFKPAADAIPGPVVRPGDTIPLLSDTPEETFPAFRQLLEYNK
jgi:hypothetical protein